MMDFPSNLLLVLGVVLFFYFGVLRPRLRYRKRIREKETRPDPGAKLLDEKKARSKVEYILVELEEIQRQVTAKLDNKIRILDALLVEAEDKIRALKRLNGGRAEPETPGETPGDFPRVAEKPQSPVPAGPASEPLLPVVNKLYEDVYALAETGISSVEIAQETGLQRGEVELILRLRQRTVSR